MPPGKSSAKQEYHKPRLKAQIDEALSAFLAKGHSIERVPANQASVPLPPPEGPHKAEPAPEILVDEAQS